MNSSDNFAHIKSLANNVIASLHLDAFNSDLNYDFSLKLKHCHPDFTPMIAPNVTGQVAVSRARKNCVLSIAENAKLDNLNVVFDTDDAFVCIGSGVRSGSLKIYASRVGECDGVMIGDDCLISSLVQIRSTDGHCIFNRYDIRVLNDPCQSITIEPHCWLGYQTSVLKGVRIGSGSIIAMNSVVTKTLPRFSLARGIPAKAEPLNEKLWAHNSGEKSMQLELKYARCFAQDVQ